MSKTYRLGIIGYAHSHVRDLARYFHNLGNRVQWIAGADVKPLVEPLDDGFGTRYGTMRETNKMIGLSHIYQDYVKMLDENAFDLVIVCAENAFHGAVCEQILKRGVTVLMEKPLSASIEDASRIARALSAGGAELILNWPSTWSPAIREAHRRVMAGEIGRLFKVTYRNGDSEGPLSYGQVLTDEQKGAEWWYQAEAGGGALLDYCCYGANLSRWFFGERAQSAYGMKANFNSHYGDADDYAVITARYPAGIAIIEGSWTTRSSGVPNGPVLFGFDGAMVVSDNEIHVYKTRGSRTPDAVYIAKPLREGRADIAQEVIHHLDTGEALHPTLQFDLNYEAMEVLGAGIRSAASGKEESI
jgi:predicted dehydrogenase